jgi:type II secretory pathway pseudopilin PulG
MKYQRGVTYLFMLFLVFLLSLGLGKVLEVCSTAVQRQKETDLLYVGALYRSAIRQYYLGSPGSVKTYPARLEDLLSDPRSLTVRRYLRRLYPDPVSGHPFVAVMAPQGGIWGVRSDSGKQPWKTTGIDDALVSVDGARTYRDWKFIYAGTQ